MSEPGGISVSELNLLIAEAIRREPRVRSVTVRGEVSGFRPHLASGHWYFSLKDEESAVSCVMFRQNNIRAGIRPRDGDRVLVSGYVDVYPKNGSYQLYAMSLRPDGTGDLFLQFEELKRKLSAEGLFDPARKRVLPMVPRKVAVVTSASGAAWQDILNVSAMRNPSVPIVLVPVTVQGVRAAAEIAAGIRAANEQTDADVLIVARGGGSAEDLWCFNDEAVARAVAASRIPVVSGVGHEIDTTICDLAADVRASTPSNAAEIVFPDRKELRGRTEALRAGLRRAAERETAGAGLCQPRKEDRPADVRKQPPAGRACSRAAGAAGVGRRFPGDGGNRAEDRCGQTDGSRGSADAPAAGKTGGNQSHESAAAGLYAGDGPGGPDPLRRAPGP